MELPAGNVNFTYHVAPAQMSEYPEFMDRASGTDPLKHMQQRAEQCRRLAKSINDERASQTLRGMADEIEEDIKNLLAEREDRTSERSGLLR